jgi:hypothetical protein
MGAIVFGLICLWAGYRWGKASEVAREFDRRWDRENEEFLDQLRSGSAS